MKKVEVQGGAGVKDGSDTFQAKSTEPEKAERDGRDVFNVQKKQEDMPKKDGRDFYHNTASIVQTSIPDKLDVFQSEKEKEKEEEEGKKVDTWEKGYQPEKLPGEDVVLKSDELNLPVPSDDTYISSAEEELSSVIGEKASAIHLQIIDLSYGFEKRTLLFEKREDYLKEIKNYIWRKKKSFERFYRSNNPGVKKVRFFLNRGFDIFSQALKELEAYHRNDSSIHLILARQLSEEGNRMFQKAKDNVKLLTFKR